MLCMAFSVYLQAAELPVTLGSTVSFAALAGSTLTNTGYTVVNGDIGVWSGSAITGFPPGSLVAGPTHIYAGDGTAATAQGDLTTAYLDAAGRNTAPVAVAGDLSGQTLPPGLYRSTSSLGITGVLTLDGQGNANSVFIFQIAGALTTGTGSQVVLIGNANAANIFWQVGSSATLGTYSTFNGTILAQASVTITTGAVLNGRALARTGAVILDSNTMANPGAPITTIAPPALAVTCPLGTAQAGVAYNSLVAATGGTPPYTFSITGSLPPTLSLIASTGLLIGTPTGAGTFSFGTGVQDSASSIATNSCSIVVAAAQADVSIAKTGPASVASNANITYNIVVANAGPSLAASVTVSDALPSGATFVSAAPSQGSCSGTSTVSCSLGTLLANGVATVRLIVRSPSASGTVVNTATVASTTPDPNLANNTSTTTLTVTATPSLAVTCPLGAAQAGVAYSSLLVATGGTPSYTYSITGSLPAGLGPITPSTGAITGTPTTAGTYGFSAGVQDSASPTPGTATSSCSITVVAAQADVSITKTGPTPASVVASANITYTLTVTNAGPSPAANVVVGDILPAGTTSVSAAPSPAGSSCSGTSTVSCSLGTLAALGSATITLVVRSPISTGTVANTATVASDTPDSNLANNTSTATVTVTAVASVPTLSTWGLALLALSLLLAGCSARFRRKAQV